MCCTPEGRAVSQRSDHSSRPLSADTGQSHAIHEASVRQLPSFQLTIYSTTLFIHPHQSLYSSSLLTDRLILGFAMAARIASRSVFRYSRYPFMGWRCATSFPLRSQLRNVLTETPRNAAAALICR